MAPGRAGLGRQGRRIPGPRRRPLPRHLPPRRPQPRRPATGRGQRRSALRGHPSAPPQPPTSTRPTAEALGDLRPIVWGDQLDLRPITGNDDRAHNLSDGQVAGYLAKYATKGAEASGTADRPLACRTCQGTGRQANGIRPTACQTCQNCGGDGTHHHARGLKLGPHAQAMIATCWRLGGLPELEYLRLRPWAHMLGFRGHFATKSRRYSTTLGCLRGARQQWRTAHTLHAHGLDTATPVARLNLQDLDDTEIPLHDDETVLVIGNWRYTGRGHTPGEALFAHTIAEDLTENRRIGRQVRSDPDVDLW